MGIPGHTNFLIVDDVETITKTLESNLKELGFTGEIYLANSVREAKQCLKSYKIHMIVSDINMPNETGIDFLKFVRSKAAYKELPFVILTASNESDDVIACIESGASNYIIKPWTLSDLEEKITHAWEKQKKNSNS